MIQFEIIGVYGLLATIDITLILGICLKHKGESLDRLIQCKQNWLESLPLKFLEIGENLMNDRIALDDTRQELQGILGVYDKIDEIEIAYGNSKSNIVGLLTLNLLILVSSFVITIIGTYITELNIMIILLGASFAILFYFFVFLTKVIYFIIKEEDKFRFIENSY